MFEDNAVPHPHCDRKPDGVEIPYGVSFADGHGWEVPRALWENKLRHEYPHRPDALFQLSGGSCMVFNSQLDRRFVVGFAFTGALLTVVGFDRSGWVASEPINIHEQPGLFLHLVIGHLYLDEEDAGFDLTVRLRSEKKEIEVGGEWYNIVDVIYVEGVLRGRATICYHVEKDGKDYVVKDSWVDTSRTDREADILEQLKGLEHVPRIIKDVPVLFRGKPDTTAYFREADPEATYRTGTYKGVEIREHRRMLLEPRARNLSEFRSLVELLTAIRDIVDGKFYVKLS